MTRGRAALASRYVDVGGWSVHVRSVAPPVPDPPRIVLVHGFVISSAYMAPLAHRLGRRFAVDAPDLPGFGRSAKDVPVLDVPGLADALARILGALGSEPVVLCANSFGAQVVVDLAVRRPDLCRALVLVGPTREPGVGIAGHVWRTILVAPRERWSLWLLHVPDNIRAGVRRIAATARAAVGDRIEEKLPLVAAPVLVVRGTRDRVVPRRWAREAARLAPSGHYAEIVRAAHALNYSAPDELAALIEVFVEEIGAAPARRPRPRARPGQEHG